LYVALYRYDGVMPLPLGTGDGPVWKVTPGKGAGGDTTDGTGDGGGAGGSGVKVGAGSNVPGCCANAAGGSARTPTSMTTIAFMTVLPSQALPRQRARHPGRQGPADHILLSYSSGASMIGS
jgi:hypothetical protein